MNANTQLSIAATSGVPAQPLADIHDRVTEAYYGKMGQQFMRETQERIHWICNNIQGRSVLDVGCSQGIVPILLAREGIKVVGVDTSPGAIEEATLHLASEPSHVQEKITFINADFLSYDFQQLKIETVVISEVLEHLVQPQSFIDAAAKLLPSNGQLIITVPFGINDFIDHKHTFYLLEPYRLITQHFEIKEIAVLGKWLGIVACQKNTSKSKTATATLSEAQIEQLEAAFFQIERNLRDDLVATRKKLDDANQKYRVVSEQIATHKQRAGQEEAARIAAEGKLQQAAAQLTQTQARLEDERKALQLQITQLSEQGKSRSAAAQEAEKKLMRLESEHESVRTRLEDANQKYRVATEQVSTLKQRVQQEETIRLAAVKELEQTQAQLSEAKVNLQEERTTLQQKIEQLRESGQANSVAAHQTEKQLSRLEATFESVRDRLEDANQKYSTSTEQISTLTQRVVQEEITRLAAVKELEQTQAQLSETQAKLQEERATLQQKIEQLRESGQANSVAAHQTEKQLIRLEATFESMRDRLEDANQKYRIATEQISTLKQRLVQEEATRLATVKELSQTQDHLIKVQAELKEERTALQQKIAQLTEQGQANSIAALEAAKQLALREVKFDSVSSQLEDANQKYRMVTEQASTLKQRLAQEEDARQQAEQIARQTAQELAHAQTVLEEDRASLQQKIAQLTEQGQANSIAALEAEKQLALHAVRFDSVRSQLEDANQKYRMVTEQASTLKQRVSQEEAARQQAENIARQAAEKLAHTQTVLEEERASLQQKIAQLTEQGQANSIAALEAEKQLALHEVKFDSVRSQLEDANQKYRMVTEQASTLKHQLSQEEAARQQAEQIARQAAQELAHTQTELEEERASLQQKIAQLSEQGQANGIAALEAEKQLVLHEVRFDSVRSQLEDANQKYRMVTEQASTLKQRLAQEEDARQQAEQIARQTAQELAHAQTVLEEDRASLQQKIAQLTEQGQANSIAALEAEKQLALHAVRFDSVRSQLEDANQKYRMVTEQASTLKQRVSQEEAARQQAENIARQAAEKLAHTQTVLQEECTSLQKEIVKLNVQERAHNVVARKAVQQHAQLGTTLVSVQRQLDVANQKYRMATKQASTVKHHLAHEEKARRIAEQLTSQTVAQLEQANLKYRKVTAEDIPNLKGKLEEHYSIKREQQHAIEQLKLDVKNNKKALSEANVKLQKLQQQKMAADQQVIKTRASLSFQLGYLLMHSVKSVRGIVGLPGALWAWRKELLKRRAQKNHRQNVMEVALPARTVQVAVKALVPEWQAPVVIQSAPEFAEHLSPALIAPASVPAKGLHALKVACIMDEFTFGSYRHECDTQQLTPDHWKAELEAFQPELLFIESAWRGKDELWGSKVGHTSKELQGIVAWCRTKNVPTVFWNKEDPVHFETFLTTAKLFDYVFTTDIDCIHRYKAALRHERVYLLPFACQPANNNPIETYDRKDAFCFAGAYYTRYPERTRDLGNFVAELPAFRPLEIYDRNFGKNDPNYQFPSEYQPYIVGTLPFDQIDKAYKGYRYAINLNSIKQSQSMFARRVFELLASNTITVSNFSRGVRLMFGDLVITTDSGSEMVRHLNNVASDEQHSRKLRLAALRKVIAEHTYAHRMAYVVSKVTKQAPQNTLPHIAVVAMAATQPELDSILQQYQQQHYANSSLLIMLTGEIAPLHPITNPRIRLVPSSGISGQTMRAVMGDPHMVAAMVAEDYYGPNYLLDIALATRYSSADIIGKGAYFTLLGGTPTLQQADAAYRPANSLPARSAAIRFNKVADAILTEWLTGLAALQFVSDNGLAIDEFNYCRNGAEPAMRDVISECVNDLQGLNTGISIDELLMRAERIAPEATGHDESAVLTGKKLAIDFGKAPSAAIKLEVEYDHWRIDSTLADATHEYLYATAEHSLNELGVDNQFKFYLDITPGLNIQLVILFLDAQKQKISHVIKHPNRNQQADIPLGTASIRFGLRFYAGGSAEIKGLVLGHRNLQPAEMIGQAEHLVLTNHYPSYEDLYRNGFVHSRVRAYRERSVRCDVFRLRPNEAVSYHEFEDIDVTTGSQEVLNQMLCSGQYKSVLVHFLDPSMWEVLQHHADRIKIVVWVHGAEIQPWHRRDFNNQTEDQRTVAKMQSEKRMTFWRELLQPIPANLKLVFVSRSFAEDVMEDLGFRIPEDHYAIIHNPINTELFSYQEKPVAQRKKVLSIRPYASKIYANDLSVKAIQQLSSKPYFYDMEFRLIGDGLLFEETLAPLREFRNVYIEQRFLKQDEIATLHKEYGIFLCPSRMDTQGVSRDEAMSSGLVPVTNAVAAIPEFVDEACGILADGEDAAGIAQGIADLYENPENFCAMSQAAALRVRQQSDSLKIIDLELSKIAAITSPTNRVNIKKH